ncbi:MAG: phage terminase large subunit [Acidobacteriota bacterium]
MNVQRYGSSSGSSSSNSDPNTNPFSQMLQFNSRPSNSIDEWETGKGGGLRAVGVGSGVTGFGASLIIVDDPVKWRAEAESETYRDNIYDWFTDDLYTRLEPRGAIILIQTRWHEDDLAGRLLKEMREGGEQWDVIDLPAIAEERVCTYEPVAAGEEPVVKPDPLNRAIGEALCPERFDIADLEKLKRKLGIYSFSALYQQSPTPADGGIFKRKWFSRTVSYVPPDVRLVRTYDLAVSTKTTADYTVSVLGGFDKLGNLYIVDVYRNRIEYPEQRRYLVNRLKDERNVEHAVELALHGQALIQDLRREPGVRATALRGVQVSTDKITRALAWANLAEEGKLILVQGSWHHDFLEEVCRFPNAPHDDQVDAVSLLLATATKRRYRHAGF